MWVAQHYRFLMLSALLCYATEFQVHKKWAAKKKFRKQKKKRFFQPFFHTSMTQNVRIFKKNLTYSCAYGNLSEFQSTFLLAILFLVLSTSCPIKYGHKSFLSRLIALEILFTIGWQTISEYLMRLILNRSLMKFFYFIGMSFCLIWQ